MTHIDNDNRSTRKSLEITTMIGCSLMCNFCPQDILIKGYKDDLRQFTLENYSMMLDKLPLDVQIVFAGYTEPWLNKLCNKFVELALTRGYHISIFTTLYSMSVAQAEELVDLIDRYSDQVLRFWIHLPDVNGNMVGFKYSDEYGQVLKIIQSSKNVNIRAMTMDSESRVSSDITADVNLLQNWFANTRAGNLNLEKIKNQTVNIAPRHNYPIECVRTKNYLDNVLLPNGDVTLCCMDYGRKHIIGNLLTQSYEDIINGEPLQNIIELNKQDKFSNNTLCRTCVDAFCTADAKHFKHPDPNRRIKLT